MAFILEQSPTFTYPIVIREVTDGGRIRTHNFEAVYNRLPASRMEEVQLAYQQIRAAVGRDQAVEAIPTREIAAEILAGWSGITTPDGQAIEYSEATKAKLLEVATVADVLVASFFEAHDKAKAKN